MDHVTLLAGVGEYRALTFSDDSNHLAFMSNPDDYKAKSPSWSVYHCFAETAVQQIATGEVTVFLRMVDCSQSSLFSDDSARLYFDTVPIADDVIEERKRANSKNSVLIKRRRSWICGTGKIRSYSRSNYCGPSQRRAGLIKRPMRWDPNSSSRSRGERCHRSA